MRTGSARSRPRATGPAQSGMRARQPGPVGGPAGSSRQAEDPAADPDQDDRPGCGDREGAPARDRGPRECSHRRAEKGRGRHDIQKEECRVRADRDHCRQPESRDRQPQVEAIDPAAAVREESGRRHDPGDEKQNVDPELGFDEERLGNSADRECGRERARGDDAVHPLPPKRELSGPRPQGCQGCEGDGWVVEAVARGNRP